MTSSERDTQIRRAAFEHVRVLQERHGDRLPYRVIAAGFQFEGERITLLNPQAGIHKPRQMQHVLSVKTVFHDGSGRLHYDDQRTAVQQVFECDEAVDYSFRRGGSHLTPNQWLRDAQRHGIPVLYLLGVAKGMYQPIVAFVSEWNGAAESIKLVFADLEDRDYATVPSLEVRRYTTMTVKRRLHQATFRQAVLSAYGNRCALSRLPELRLLDAAHIVPDKDEKLGQPTVTNGLPLSKIHHAAFDANLIGVDPHFRLHVSSVLTSQQDGPMLQALKDLDGKSLHLPKRKKDYPDSDRLHQRYQEFQQSQPRGIIMSR